MIYTKRLLLVLFCLLPLLLSACSSGGTATVAGEETKEETITLRVGAGVGNEHLIMLSYLNRWMEEVEKQTDYRVRFELLNGGSLVAMGREFDALHMGLVDIAMPIHQVYDPVRFPLSEVTMLPLLESDVRIATAAYEDLVQSDVLLDGEHTFYELEFGSRDLKLWPTVTTESYQFSFSNINSIESMSDLQNLTFRSTGRVAEIFSDHFGINAITLPAADLYDVLSKNSIDGLYFSIPDWPSWGITDLLQYTISGVNLGHFSFMFGMTQETWDSLPTEVQEVMEKVAKEELQSEKTYEIYDDRTNKSVDQFKGNGGKIVEFKDQPADVQASVEEAMVETWYTWIELNEQNGLPGRETAILWKDLILKHGGEVPEKILEIK